VGFSRWSVFVMTPLSLVGPIFTEMDDGITRIEGCGHFPGPAVIHAGYAYGLDEDEDLVKVDLFGRTEVLIRCLQMPSGARPTSPSSSRGVLYLGNWAVEICSGKVLWCVRGLAPATPAIPAGDGLLVLGTSDGELVGLVDPSAPKRGALAGAAGPRDVDGVLLKDGRQIEGAVERRPGGSLRVVPEGGNPVEVREEEVAVATAAGATLFISEQYDTYVIWRDLLNAGLIDALESVFDSYRRAGLVQEARRLLLEVRDLGIGVERYGEWDTRLTRVRERRSRQVLKNLRAREVVVREAAYRSRVVASKWCRKRGLGGAAAVLLRDADRVRPGRAEIGSLGWGLVPMSFPFRRHEELVRLWLEWVARILPAGGEFIPPWDDAWKRVQDPPWNEGTVGLRTRNLLVFSREHDPEIVGACLRHGEGTVRALDLLLCGRSSVAPQDDSGRLEVRIHRSQREFEGWGGGPLEWIAGYYSPARRVSCFFVPRRSGTATLQERRLYRVLAHELTHQYVAERWVRGGRRASGKAPGYWIVEGIAEFVEDQTVEMGRSELTLDDESVRSLEITSQLELQGKLMDLDRFLDMGWSGFARLDREPEVRVQFRNGKVQLSELNIFYDQAASLFFYLVHKAGPAARQALIEFIRTYYLGSSEPESWKQLGFERLEDLRKGYWAFLRGLREKEKARAVPGRGKQRGSSGPRTR
jgi:hypothetical protein